MLLQDIDTKITKLNNHKTVSYVGIPLLEIGINDTAVDLMQNYDTQQKF